MKERILNIGSDQMKAGGYEALSFRKIAESLDISKANVHHHFKNKEILAIEILNAYIEEHFTNFLMLGKKHKGDLYGFIMAAEDLFWIMSEQLGHCGICVCDQIARDMSSPEILRKLTEKHSEDFLSMLEELVESAFESGQLKKELNPKDISLQINMMMSGMMNMAQSVTSVKEAKKRLSGVVKEWVKTLLA